MSMHVVVMHVVGDSRARAGAGAQGPRYGTYAGVHGRLVRAAKRVPPERE